MHMQNLGADIKCIMIYVKMVNLKRGLSSNGFNPQRISRDLQWVVTTEHINLIKYKVFSHAVTAAILVSQNNETAAMLMSQTSPVGVRLFSYVNAFFCSNKFA